ncbi:Cytochrome c-type biogenesis protein CcmE, heme chaperone [Marinobacterium lacunae]|uniref:Cytochrome c-type biogenesis protein CcmE n=1 Tax=Marinobacterium lacunae TaxID=1232683 RepID=A0A081G0G4_9GAMM|nr:cytochrome c maturation protein CcmE [Marinobacterium lacunae]KEA64269.1 Cytochrome c-type biogenesis protein CcmE, heme chaperone [Marinobacterium lacunae]
MNPKRKQRLLIVLFIVAGVGVAVGLTLFALNQNINLFYSPSQIAAGEAPTETRIRAGGMVVDGSVQRANDSLEVGFDITDYEHTVHVRYTGILPDLFREGQGIVAQGELDKSGVLQAVEVLAKHDENYMPPEVAEALEKAGKMPKPTGQEFNK